MESYWSFPTAAVEVTADCSSRTIFGCGGIASGTSLLVVDTRIMSATIVAATNQEQKTRSLWRSPIKKGAKRGTYKIRVKVTAAGNASYMASSVTETVTVKVR